MHEQFYEQMCGLKENELLSKWVIKAYYATIYGRNKIYKF